MNYAKSYVFSFPTVVEYGVDTRLRVAPIIKEKGGQKALIVTDKGVEKIGLLDQIVEMLRQEGIACTVFSEVSANPKDLDVAKGVEMLNSDDFDAIIALGGGSSMDCAKAIRAMKYHDGTICDYDGFFKFSMVPDMTFICIPTTSGTGSEVGGFAVITDSKRKVKMGICDPALSPTVAIVDPVLTLSLPPHLTASTGIDALSHAMEVFVANAGQPITDAFAYKSMELVGLHLRKAVGDGTCLESRTGMAEASMLAGCAMSNCDCGAIHAMAEAVGGLYDLPHGLAIGIFMPFVMEHNLIARPEKYARIAEALGEKVHDLSLMEAARASVKAVWKLMGDIGFPQPSSLGLKEEDIPTLARMSSESGTSDYNPRPMTYEAYVELYTQVYKYDK
jgi:alcohol dehydrogenase